MPEIEVLENCFSSALERLLTTDRGGSQASLDGPADIEDKLQFPDIETQATQQTFKLDISITKKHVASF